MSFTRVSLAAVIAAAAIAGIPAVAQEHQHPAGEKLGTVNFETSCTPAAKPAFDRAMALLHSFEFGAAIDGFTKAVAADPDCTIAYWGIALSRWSNPFSLNVRPPAQLAQGLNAIREAEKRAPKTERERAYVAAVAKLYQNAETTDQRTRVLAYSRAMADLKAKYPTDREAAIFHALSLTASALPTDKTYANQLEAGRLLEKLYPEQPDHPGISHYIIHSYDVPALAPQALESARRYSKIAPSAPHALHMPSHTFTRVGSWQDSIESNIASAAAARRDKTTAEELHAMDYMTYAYLQTGQDKAVDALVKSLPEVLSRFDVDAIGGAAPGSAGVFAAAAIPVRQALEHRNWAAAAKLQPQTSRFGYPEALTHFARALGAAHTGAPAVARNDIAALQQIQDRLTAANEGYWAEQVNIQRQIATAFLALAEGRKEEALTTMRAAAAREDATEKSAVTPGPVAPARELLGDMLLTLQQPADALKEYQVTLKKEPNRFRAMYGAAKASALSGNQAAARTHYQQLLTICERADKPGRPELEEARKAAGR